MKKILMLVTTVLLTSVLILAGCGSNGGLKNNPATDAAVTNNGGITVQKGNYLYFVNGYKDVTELKAGDNDWGDTKHGAIYRVKIGSENSLSYDKDGFLLNAELVVPKIVGYKNGSFQIYGDYIYYTSPNNNKDKKGDSLTTLTDYFRVNIDGTENEKLYTSKTADLTQKDWTIYALDSNQYLVVKDGTELISVKASGKISSPVTMATEVTSASFVESDTYYNNKQAVVEKVNNYVYYTRNKKDSDKLASSITGNYLARVKVNTTNEEIIYSAGENTFTMVALKNKSIYYTKRNANNTVTQLLFKSELSNLNSSTQLTYMDYTSTFILDNETEHVGNYVLALSDNYLYLLNGSNAPILILNDSMNILSVKGDHVIFYSTTNGTINVIKNIKDANPTVEEIELDGKIVKYDSINAVDYDGRTLYVFADYAAKETNSAYQYLNRVDLNTTEPKLQFVGVFLDEHIPAKPDNTGKLEEDWEIWIK